MDIGTAIGIVVGIVGIGLGIFFELRRHRMQTTVEPQPKYDVKLQGSEAIFKRLKSSGGIDATNSVVYGEDVELGDGA